ncbi:cell division protein ZapA [Aurantimonas sp. VKM B-3413]|uniref:cell division protein ZapA n=1 Tax=Aurantimonas sp. VKM B-3413 TaxID=2779401 RepID=UPI001E5B08E4|nr:cell division protein ZapA [Aurantimonas sp. VKM B-3413]MCB8837062.1 cell division protein ZapA [Aurantimonas sp. VKM B-3413]
MPQVVVTIDGKTYRMACAEGEEDHLADLAADVDGKIAGLREAFGQIGDLRLTVMAAIQTADELFEARRKIRELEGGLDLGPADAGEREMQHLRERREFVEALDEAAAAIERLSARLTSGK